MGIFKVISGLLMGIGRKVLESFLDILKSDVGKFIADAKPLALKAVESATKLDLDGDGKRDHAKEELIKELKGKGIEYKDRYINLLLELVVNEVFPPGTSTGSKSKEEVQKEKEKELQEKIDEKVKEKEEELTKVIDEKSKEIEKLSTKPKKKTTAKKKS